MIEAIMRKHPRLHTALTSRLTRRSALLGGLAATLGLLLAPRDEPAPDNSQSTPNPLSQPRVRLAHLLRRAGFGATKEELDYYERLGYEGTVDYLLNYEAVSDPIEDRLAALALDLAKQDDLKRWWLVRMAHTTRPLQEKMVLFWHGLLTSGFSKVNHPELLLRQNEFFRQHALGNFRDIVQGISKDGAMLIWLDGRGSRKGRPNENYARELMELFTTGIGHYTEQDVREGARAFTGWTVTKEGEVRFNPRAHDAGIKTFLGRTGNFDGDDIVYILTEQRAAAEYISGRLFSFFAYRDPEPEIVEALADTYFASGFNIKMVVRHILLSDAFSSPRAYRSLVRGPVDLAVSAYRLLGLEADGASIVGRLRAMGQDVFNPPNVAGWPGGASWLNSSTWFQRVNYANLLTSRRKPEGPSILNLTKVVEDYGITRPQELVQHFVDHLVDGNLSPGARDVLDDYLFSSNPLSLEPRSLNRKGRALVYLLMACPEYQLM